jgi:hypothetical protein
VRASRLESLGEVIEWRGARCSMEESYSSEVSGGHR